MDPGHYANHRATTAMKMYCFSRNISSSAPVSRSPSVTSLVVLNPSLTSQSPGKLLKKYLISEPHQVDQNTGVGGVRVSVMGLMAISINRSVSIRETR